LPEKKGGCNTFYFDYVDKCRKMGIQVPIIPGGMPVYTIKMTQMLCKVCGGWIPDSLKTKLDAVDEADKDAVLKLVSIRKRRFSPNSSLRSKIYPRR
jgi:5,10-methylenetetrahydrofolate reductase